MADSGMDVSLATGMASYTHPFGGCDRAFRVSGPDPQSNPGSGAWVIRDPLRGVIREPPGGSPKLLSDTHAHSERQMRETLVLRNLSSLAFTGTIDLQLSILG